MIVACLHSALTAYSVLADHQLVVGPPRVSVSVHEAGDSNSHLFKKEFVVDEPSPPAEVAQQLATRVEAALRPGEVGGVDARVNSPGVVLTGEADPREERVCRLGVSAFLDYLTVDLVTSSDAWMPYDLKGRPQPAVYAANAPRLSATLRDLSEALDMETDPDDPTYFGKPTEFGVENHFDDDGTASDVWSSFEVLNRYDAFTHTPGFGRIGYKRNADGEVQYVPVRNERQVLGYLWASDAENAASFEPRDVGDDDVYKEGLKWLDRLRSAHDRGLSPSQALAELADLSEDDEPGTCDLASLRGLTSED
ncbi:hypothetical protein ABVG11_20175 [Streptomyces sp. HD1123-B1]|uniref:hypothetical protein n=1 Tax=Streptomyces huangiella TaxID=3228804 RepID=UPI003D7EC7A5